MKVFFLYIDPNSGSYLIQMLIAGILGSLFFFKNIWLKIKKKFIKKRRPIEEDSNNEL
jgi:hypothetical protein